MKIDVDRLAEDALDAACLCIQEAVCQKDGGLAGIVFSGPRGDLILDEFKRYIELEIQFKEDEGND
jgi:hypothetical protein